VWSALVVGWQRIVMACTAIAVAVGLTVAVVARRGSPHRSQIEGSSIVMLGDSITEQADWASLLPDVPVANRGYSGYTTEQLLPVAESVGDSQPRAVFVLTGTNDIRDGRPPEWTATHLRRLLDSLTQRSPDTIIVVQTILPRADQPAAVDATNEAVRTVAAGRGLRVLDLHAPFDDGAGGLRADETTDGLHLSPSGYRRWASLLAPLITDL
jgi:lysophospholipase L1-like esterase